MGINVGPQTNCILLYTLKKDESQYHTIKPGKVIPESGEVILERGKVILERGKVIYTDVESEKATKVTSLSLYCSVLPKKVP